MFPVSSLSTLTSIRIRVLRRGIFCGASFPRTPNHELRSAAVCTREVGYPQMWSALSRFAVCAWITAKPEVDRRRGLEYLDYFRLADNTPRIVASSPTCRAGYNCAHPWL